MGLRTKVALPLLLAILLVAGLMLGLPRVSQTASTVFLAVIAVLLVTAAAQLEVSVLRPLRKLQRLLPEDGGNPGSGAGTWDVAVFAEGVQRLRDKARGSEAALKREVEQRQQLEQSLREVEERYVLAVERANDGLWEWDLKTDAARFSPRWKGMLGYLDANLQHVEDWKHLIHPMDKDGVLMRLTNHLDGLTPYFDAEYRVLHRDGRYRWVHSRGTAIRHASGKSYRIVVMDNDIHARKELEQTLIQAAEGLSSVSGMDFFQALMKNLAAILGTRDNLVCQCLDDPPTKVRTLAYYSGGKFWDNFDHELEGTSCGAVIARKEGVYVPTGVCNTWPLEREYNRDSYLGVPLFDSSGKIIGHFACMDDKPMRQDLPHLAIFRIFSVRAAAELERTLLKQKLGTPVYGEHRLP